MNRGFIPSALVLLAAMFLAGQALGQDKAASREREALRRVQQQVQQLRQEKTALEEKLATAEQEKAKLSKENESLAQARTGLERDRKKLAGQVTLADKQTKEEATKALQLQALLDAANQDRQALAAQKAGLETRLAELAAKNATTERELAQVVAVRTRVESNLGIRDKELESCEGKNVQLYTHGRSLIDQCRDRSATDRVLRLEPFTGIGRVALENNLEEYRDKFDAQKLIPQTTQR